MPPSTRKPTVSPALTRLGPCAVGAGRYLVAPDLRVAHILDRAVGISVRGFTDVCPVSLCNTIVDQARECVVGLGDAQQSKDGEALHFGVDD